jgi:tetratricopeptide (TPR) repeat protein
MAATILALGLVAYLPATGGPFVFDDFQSFVTNPTIRDVGQPLAVLSPPRESPMAGRPVVNATLAVNYAIDGLNPRGYHVFNIALHLACALLIFALVGRVAGEPIGFATAVIWVVHPLASEAVNYLTQRTELVMSLCYLATVYASARALDGTRTFVWQMAAIAACAVGMASKESMVTAPVMVVLFDRCMAFDSFSAAFRARWRLYAGLAATWIVLAGLMAGSPRTLAAGFAGAHVTPWAYLLDQTRIVIRYLRLAFWPGAFVINYGWATDASLSDVWPYALGLVALAMATIVAFVRVPRVGLAAAWFFVLLAPTSSIVPIGAEVGAERRVYLALAGLVVLVVVATGRIVRARATQLTLLGGVVVALIGVTWHRDAEYASALMLAETTLVRWPTSTAHHMVGTELAKLGRHDEAIAELRQAAAGYPPARYNLGAELLQAGQLDAGIAELRAAAQAEPAHLARRDAEVLIGQALAAEEKWTEVASQADRILAAVPGDPDALGLRALASFEQQKFDDAVKEYRAYLAARPNDASALGNAAIALMMTGQTSDAVAAFRRVVDLDGNNLQARINLARALAETTDVAGARREIDQVLRADPNNAAARQLQQMLLGRGK